MKFIFSSITAILAVGSSLTWSAGVETEKCFSVTSQVIAQSGEFFVTIADVQASLDDRVTPEHQAGVLQSDDRFGQLLRDLMITQQFSAFAAQHPEFDARDEAVLIHRINAIMRAWYRGHYLASIELDDYSQLARELHLTRPSLFTEPERFDFLHLLIQVEPDRSEAEAMAVILDLIGRVEAGEDFQALVMEWSDDPGVADSRGTITGVTLDELVTQLGAVLITAEPGRLTDPVRSRFGWHLAKLLDTHPPSPMPWEEAKPLALQIARENHLNDAWERRLREASAEPMQIDPAAVEALRRSVGGATAAP